MSSLPSNGRRRTPRARLAGVALALGAAGLVGGCGSPAKTASTAPAGPGKAGRPTTTVAPEPQKPACSLVTQAEIEAALGVKAAPGREMTEPRQSECSFAVAGAADQVVVVVSATSATARDDFTSARQKAGPSAQTLTAGDGAFVAGPQAAVVKGRTFATVLVAVRQAGPQASGAATKIIQAVAARL